MIQTAGPSGVTRKENTGRHIKIGMKTLISPVTIHGSLTVRRPAQSSGQTLCRPTPELVRPNRSIAGKSAEIRHAGIP